MAEIFWPIIIGVVVDSRKTSTLIEYNRRRWNVIVLSFFFFIDKRPSATGIPTFVPVPVVLFRVKKPFSLPVSPNIKLYKTISINAIKSRCYFLLLNAYFHKNRENNTNTSVQLQRRRTNKIFLKLFPILANSLHASFRKMVKHLQCIFLQNYVNSN